MAMTWSHAFVNVKNLDAMLSFYVDVLGFQVTDSAEGVAFLSQLDDEHHQIAFNEQPDRETDTGRVGHFAFRVESLDEVLRLYHELSDNQNTGKVVPITHGNTWSIYFQDPEQNGIEVFCDTPWNAVQPVAKPWDPDLSREDLEQYTQALIETQGETKPNPRYQA